MKIMNKAEAYNKVLWENETLVLRTLRHPNILEWVESYEDKKTFHLITVLCQGGELFDRVKNGSFSEKVAARLAREMLQALQYCHANNIVHRGQQNTPDGCTAWPRGIAHAWNTKRTLEQRRSAAAASTTHNSHPFLLPLVPSPPSPRASSCSFSPL